MGNGIAYILFCLNLMLVSLLTTSHRFNEFIIYIFRMIPNTESKIYMQFVTRNNKFRAAVTPTVTRQMENGLTHQRSREGTPENNPRHMNRNVSYHIIRYDNNIFMHLSAYDS